jgi:hypothetical protein
VRNNIVKLAVALLKGARQRRRRAWHGAHDRNAVEPATVWCRTSGVMMRVLATRMSSTSHRLAVGTYPVTLSTAPAFQP